MSTELEQELKKVKQAYSELANKTLEDVAVFHGRAEMEKHKTNGKSSSDRGGPEEMQGTNLENSKPTPPAPECAHNMPDT